MGIYGDSQHNSELFAAKCYPTPECIDYMLSSEQSIRFLEQVAEVVEETSHGDKVNMGI